MNRSEFTTMDSFGKFLDAARSKDPRLPWIVAYRAWSATRSKTLDDVQNGLPGVELTDAEWHAFSLATRAIAERGDAEPDSRSKIRQRCFDKAAAADEREGLTPGSTFARIMGQLEQLEAECQADLDREN